MNVVPTHADLRRRVEAKMQIIAEDRGHQPTRRQINQLCLAISVLGTENPHHAVLAHARDVEHLRGREKFLRWVEQRFLEEIFLLDHACHQVLQQVRRSGIHDEALIEACMFTAMEDFLGTLDEWHEAPPEEP